VKARPYRKDIEQAIIGYWTCSVSNAKHLHQIRGARHDVRKHAVAKSTIARLRKENDDLRDLVVRLSNLVLRSVIVGWGLPQPRESQELPPVPAAMASIEIIPRLREAALHCAQVSRECTDAHTARELEGLSVELADAAEGLQAAFAVPRGES
jgi:hypothetical protein